MAFVRVDNRLVHGQIIESWLPFTHARTILVVNDELAADYLRQEIMSLAIPAGVRIEFLPVGAIMGFLSRNPLESEDALILFATCAGIEAAMRFGTRPSIRRALALAVLCTGLLVWVELAVGIVGPG